MISTGIESDDDDGFLTDKIDWKKLFVNNNDPCT